MTKQIYQIQMALTGIKPKVWRRILVDADTSLLDFHNIIQTTMGWMNEHMHQFIKDRIYYAPKEFEMDDTIDTKKVLLSDLLKMENDKIKYEYDFGDSWIHDVILEKILPFDKKTTLPVCITGKGCCPPEDCGGIPGYEHMLKVMSNPKDKEYKEMKEWLGGGYDPEDFDIEVINKGLQQEDYGCFSF